ncbi:MAG: hypothetical protein ACLQIH_00085 [Myxococcaceae bacterium]
MDSDAGQALPSDPSAGDPLRSTGDARLLFAGSGIQFGWVLDGAIPGPVVR